VVDGRAASAARPAPRSGYLARRQAIEFYICISPWLIGFLVFTLGPLVGSLWLSLHEWDLISAPEWRGLSNYWDLLTVDPLFWQSLRVTAIYVVSVVIIHNVLALLVALLLNNRFLPGRNVMRTVFYVPSVTSGVAIALLWQWIYNPDFGLINVVLWDWFKIKGPMWIYSAEWALPSLIFMASWSIGTGMVLYLAGLQGVPEELRESAMIDGAGSLAVFRHVTLPMLSPVIFFNVVIQVIGSFQVFTSAFVMTNGGPGNATLFYVLQLFNRAFVEYKMGSASAMAWILFVILLAFTYFQFRVSQRAVYYEGEAEGRNR
jgi:multiple sugar transport system permease protein